MGFLPATRRKSDAMPCLFDLEVQDLLERSRNVQIRNDIVLFYGSSSFTLWHDIDRHFPQYTVLNHGFGGSTLTDCLEYFDRLVVGFAPKALIVYAGDNDLANGDPPEAVLANLEALIERKRAAYGALPTAYVSIKVSPARFSIMHKIAYTNLIIERLVAPLSDVRFIDIIRHMTSRGLEPFLGYYASDPLHMNEGGYRILARCIGEYLADLDATGVGDCGSAATSGDRLAVQRAKR